MTDTQTNSLPPLYLFIIWHNAEQYEDEIKQDIKSHFDMFRTYRISWLEEYFTENLTRFYGKKLPKGCKKQKETGTGDFTVVLVYDNEQDMAGGNNRNTILTKAAYRKKCHANLIHATDNAEETNENLLFLFGKTVKEIVQEKTDDDVISYHHDLVGCPCWASMDQALEIANKIPQTEVRKDKNTVRICSRNVDLVQRLLNARKSRLSKGKYFIKIQDKEYPVYIGK